MQALVVAAGSVSPTLNVVPNRTELWVEKMPEKCQKKVSREREKNEWFLLLHMHKCILSVLVSKCNVVLRDEMKLQ